MLKPRGLRILLLDDEGLVAEDDELRLYFWSWDGEAWVKEYSVSRPTLLESSIKEPNNDQ